MTIGQVSELVGVPVTTLRSWERRYQIPPRTRTQGTTRRYTVHEAQMLTLMRDDVSRGIRAAEAAGSVCALFDADRASARFVIGLLQACDQLDAAAIGTWLDRAVAELGLGRCLDEVLFPGLRRIGLNWQTGQCDVSHEHAATAAIGAWLRDRAAAIPPAPGRPLVLLAPTDQHNVGLRALAVLLHHRQLRCAGLPCGLPTPELSAKLRTGQPAAVVLLSHLSGTRPPAVERLRMLQTSGAELFYAGNAFASPRSRRGLPGHYLGLSLQDAAELIDVSLHAEATHPLAAVQG
jgi:hypothetical protein